ncbi:hypothetical protein [Gracilimonas tropica]|uniref:hypothetical protein n=1 Tax=Gracilimonas tropica TaxID=454600 RepID=UPI00036A61B9|nr:hypothetical protein [Gracilimonas tropica]
MDKIKLNPGIKKKADELFELIEKEVKEKHEDDVAEAMAAEWGDYLKNSKGFDMLNYGMILTLTESEHAKYSLEESFRYMSDEAAYTVSYLAHYALRAAKKWSDVLADIKEAKSFQIDSLHTLDIFIRELKSLAHEVEKETATLWIYRAKGYREELEKIKNAS